ncbi:MAG: DUF3710 domain-containing protein [Bifidobacteriaceae bacterium]|nr:DUF3710 domain-containing protein [Bifidobacteriaceae bacterium]
MALFKRRRGSEDSDVGGAEARGGQIIRPDGEADDELDGDGQSDQAASGPYDKSERPSLDGLVDFGAIRLPLRAGLKVTLGGDKGSPQPTTLTVQKSGSQMALHAFAAPKTLGIWEEMIADLEGKLAKQGGKTKRAMGRFGPELLAEMPTTTAQGRTGKQVIRFIGVDGPRWLLRGTLAGKAVREEAAAAEIEDLFAGVVVARGDEARPPREALPLKVPGLAGDSLDDAPSGDGSGPTDLLERGPEITEVR